MGIRYRTPTALQMMAGTLREACAADCRLAPLVLFTDPRLEDVEAAAAALPRNIAAVVYRHFGAPNRFDVANRLRKLTRARGQQLLIGNDPGLAEDIGADGVHCRRDAALSEATEWREDHPHWIITMAGIKEGDYLGNLMVLDALFVSAIFPSDSPSADGHIGSRGLIAHARSVPVPVYALGGVNAKTCADLAGTGAAGLAFVSGLERIMDRHIEKTQDGDTVQFRAHIDGFDDVAVLDLRKLESGTFAAIHTGVPESMGGRGVGKALVEAMVEDAKASGYRVRPDCSFVDAMFRHHPAWAEVST